MMINGMRVMISETVDEVDHVGDTVTELRAHPLAAFFLRLIGKSDIVMYLRGEPIYRPQQPRFVMVGDTIYCSSRGLAALRRELGAAA